MYPDFQRRHLIPHVSADMQTSEHQVTNYPHLWPCLCRLPKCRQTAGGQMAKLKVCLSVRGFRPERARSGHEHPSFSFLGVVNMKCCSQTLYCGEEGPRFCAFKKWRLQLFENHNTENRKAITKT